MNIQSITNYIILVLLIIFSAIFSGSETSFFSLNHFEKEKLKQQKKGKIQKFILHVLDAPEQILITILTGNMIVNLFFAALLDNTLHDFGFSEGKEIFSILIGTGIILIFGEMTPKNFAIRHSLPFFRGVSGLLFLVYYGITPVRKFLRLIEKGIITWLSKRMRPSESNDRQLVHSTLQLGFKKGLIQHSELAILETFFDFREKTVEDIMIPRTQISGIEISASISKIVNSKIVKRQIEENKLNIPVYKKDIDHIAGYINLNDLIPFIAGQNKNIRLSAVIRMVYPVPETKKLLNLLQELIENDIEVAVVVDEYGGTAGIATLQDLLEKFLKFFYPETNNVLDILDENRYYLSANFPLERLCKLIDLEIETENRTLGGFLTEKLGEIPVPGIKINIGNYDFLIKKVSKNRILNVEVKKV